MFQEYPQNDVNEPILLHEGRFRVRRGDRLAEGPGSARLIWLPSPGIEIDIQITAPRSSVDFDFRVELPGFRTENPLVHSITMGPNLPNLRIGAFVSLLESADDCDLVSVGFQVVNFTNFITPGLSATPGDPTVITSGAPDSAASTSLPAGSVWSCAASRLRHDGWHVNLVAVPESTDVYKGLKASGGYGFTHVGQLTRVDGSAFTAHQAETILESLTAFLSFAHGAACSLPIRWGRGTTGEVVWRHFGSPVVDRWRQPHSWFDERHGELLTELFDAFCRRYNDETLRDPLILVLHWYRHCNTQSSGMEGSLILGMTALDLLSALIVAGRCRSMSARKHDKLKAEKKLCALLKKLDVPADIPSRYAKLTAFAEKNYNKSDSCKTLAELRNGFVHPIKERRDIVFGADGKAAAFDAWQLSLWYQELALLYLLDHRGSYANRTTQRWVGQVEPVPWSGHPVSVSGHKDAP